MRPMADTSSDNGRVTMAVLGTKLDTVLQQLTELAACARADHDRVIGLESTAKESGRRIAELEGVTKARTWETRIVEALLALLASLGVAVKS